MAGPLLGVCAAAFGGGILIAGAAHPFLGWSGAVAAFLGGLAGLALIAWRGRAPSVPVAIGITSAFLLLGCGWGALHEWRVARSPLAGLDARAVRVWGSFEGEPELGRFGWTGSLRARLVVVTPPGYPAFAVRDPLWLQGDDRPPRIRPGDSVVVEGTISPPSPDGFGAHLARSGYPAILDVRRLRVLGPAANPLVRGAWLVRSSLAESLGRVFPPKQAGLLMGLSLGDTSRLDPGVEEDFRATGLSHLTAVSGSNLVMFLAPVLGLGVLLGFGRRGMFVLGAVAAGFFVLLTGGEPSVLRAAAMAWITMTGVFLGRPRSPPAIMGGAVLALLAVNPTLVHAIGFQLSVAATGGMALVATPLAGRLGFLPRWLSLPAATTIGAQVGVTPLLLYHFGLVPTVTVLANVLAFPSVAPAMVLGLAAGCAALISTPLGSMLAAVARAPLEYLEGVAHWLARAPFPIVTSPGGQVAVLVVGISAVLVSAWWFRSERRAPKAFVVGCVALLALFVWSGALRAGPPSLLTVTFFDVGQGDAALVRSPGGASILIDGGPEQLPVARKLAALGVRRLDVVIATHAHADHVAGLPAVLARFAVALVLDPGCEGESPFYTDFVRAVRRAGVPFRHPHSGSVLMVGDIRMEILGPDRCFVGTESDPNNDSLVLRLTLGRSAILFSGDAEQPAQEEMVEERPASLEADVLKVPHHGGDTSTPEFLGAIHARFAVVSVGPNRYGHPVPSVLAALGRLGMRVFRTDRSGDVTVRFSGDHLLIQSGHG